MPWFWIVAGPNGAGKTTFTRKGIIEQVTGQAPRCLNPDDRTAEILAADPAATDANLRAAQEVDAEVADRIERGLDVLVETVLSSDKFIDDVVRARTLGFSIGMIYVGLATPEDAVRRVALRVALHGHDVATQDIERRYARSIGMLARFVALLDLLFVFDNSAPSGKGTPTLLAQRDEATGKVTLIAPGRIPAIDAALAPFT